jgi:hypothetical protein
MQTVDNIAYLICYSADDAADFPSLTDRLEETASRLSNADVGEDDAGNVVIAVGRRHDHGESELLDRIEDYAGQLESYQARRDRHDECIDHDGDPYGRDDDESLMDRFGEEIRDDELDGDHDE